MLEGLLELGEWLSKAQKYFVNSQSTILRWLSNEEPIFQMNAFNLKPKILCLIEIFTTKNPLQ